MIAGSQIEDPSSEQDPGGVVLSDGKSVSLQVVQQVYKEITGKTELISQRFEINHLATFEDLENLNRKIHQLLEQYSVEHQSCSITFFHENEASERYSSLERARLHEAASLSPTEGVAIEYDFLIVLPKARQPQPYKITINLGSRLVLLEKMRKQRSLNSRVWRFLTSDTGGVSIEYVDYAVARNMRDAVAQWFGGLNQIEAPWWISVLRVVSPHADWVLKNVTAVVIACVAFLLWRSDQEPTVAQALIMGLVAFTSIFVGSGLALRFGIWIEDLSDRQIVLSALQMNRGDDRLISGYRRSQTKGLVAIALGIAGVVAVNVAAGLLTAATLDLLK